jgi:NAD(P)-dependent dehydrogenase (short-subunit alcohol dehydrogenase family)
MRVRRAQAIVANLSARVGSVSDNRLGGWWSYRMSKAALNMATVNMALELRRRDVYAVSLHPGTTDTGLSVPFQQNVKPEKLFTTEYSTGAMLDVLDKLTPEDTGGFFAFDGSKIEF